ncbi:MAG: sugar-binding domain-containing protein, partial [Clostridia bacterium]
AGYISLDAAGMTLTPQAEPIVQAAHEISRAMRGLAALESSLSRALDIPRVVVVPGDADRDDHVLQDIGRAAAQRVRALLSDHSILALTGGNTIAAVAHALQPASPLMNLLVLPARGGMGRAVETQAGTLAAEFARKLGGHYRLLHLPDQLEEAAREEILKIPEVLLHGIGCANEMARHRHLPAEVQAQLRQDGAVAEAFGYFFDIEGHPVYEASCMGMDIASLTHIHTMVAVAAGTHKAAAMLAVLRHNHHEMLVTDEGAARAILSLIGMKTN